MLLSSILGCGALFYLANYSIYRYYFTKPLKALSFPQIVLKYLKRGPFQKMKQQYFSQSYLVELKFGLNHKPISGKYLRTEEQIQSQFSTLFINGQNGYQHLTAMNVKNIQDFEQGINVLAQQNFQTNYLLLNIHHQVDDMNNTYKIKFDQKKFIVQQEIQTIEQLKKYYVYFLLKNKNDVKICQNFGDRTQDIDFFDKLIQFTIKNQKQVEYIDLNEEWFNENYKDCVSIIKIDDQYNIINVTELEKQKIQSDQRIYDKLIQNLNKKTILYI